jgi:hypothetical protein
MMFEAVIASCLHPDKKGKEDTEAQQQQQQQGLPFNFQRWHPSG